AGATLLRLGLAAEMPEVRRFDHHMCHAAAACHSAPFADGLCLVIDGEGEVGAASLFRLQSGRMAHMMIEAADLGHLGSEAEPQQRCPRIPLRLRLQAAQPQAIATGKQRIGYRNGEISLHSRPARRHDERIARRLEAYRGEGMLQMADMIRSSAPGALILEESLRSFGKHQGAGFIDQCQRRIVPGRRQPEIVSRHAASMEGITAFTTSPNV
ncbi:MAG: hypothetical protein EON93_23750, partial [Burkholderiales bacterium]